MSQPARIGALPPEFTSAVHELAVFEWDRRLDITELDPPAKIAPYAAAIDADIESGDAGGRLIVLYDPAGNPAWEGAFRCVSFARAELPEEMARDQLLVDVGWSWLTEALQTRGAAYLAASGTVTTTTSTSFGALADKAPSGDIEIRASWTPMLDADHRLDCHLAAWQSLLLQVAGLPPDPAIRSLADRMAAR